MNDIVRAINFAEKAHRGQFRKDGVTPFIIHPFRVYSILVDDCLCDDDTDGLILRQAALLHDVIEDTNYNFTDIKDEFGIDVANLVWEITKEGSGKQGHLDYCTKLSFASDNASIIKWCDIWDNINDLDNSDSDFNKYFYRKVADYLSVLPYKTHLTTLIKIKVAQFNYV